ncbi:MAG: hypothetical protein NTW58_04380 [Actinobacteria bacterium]|nr:hypothetical protein [Actinomycetota bacterium]
MDVGVGDRLGGDLHESAQQVHVGELARPTVVQHGQADGAALADQGQLQHLPEAEAAVLGPFGRRDTVVCLDVGGGERLCELDGAYVQAHETAQLTALDLVDLAARRPAP